MSEKIEFPVLEDWLLASDVADVLGVSRQTVNRLINNGTFKSTNRLGVRESSKRPTYVVAADEVERLRRERAGEPLEDPVEPVPSEPGLW